VNISMSALLIGDLPGVVPTGQRTAYGVVSELPVSSCRPPRSAGPGSLWFAIIAFSAPEINTLKYLLHGEISTHRC
jgi:hypothetical protein